MQADSEAPPGSFRILILDQDAGRGAKTAGAITSCGFPAAASDTLASALEHARTQGASILVVEHGASKGGERAATSPRLDPSQISKLRDACGKPLVIAWTRDVGAADGEKLPPWAHASIRGLDALIGRVALHAAAEGSRTVPGDPATLQRDLEEARAAAHDISQPLTTILARTQLLLAKMTEDDPNYRALSIISQEADRLAQTLQRFQALRRHRS